MGNNLDSGSELDDFFATNDTNLALEDDDDSMVSSAQIDKTALESDGFTPASEENLSRLEVGCFVLVLRDDVYCWAEVVSVEDDTINGRLNNELSVTVCMVEHHTLEITPFHRDQIKAMGCDRYCWC